MTAPNFGDSEYPAAGERIGPAWQKIWDFLADKTLPVSKYTIIESVLATGLDLKPKTIDGLLWNGYYAGHLEKHLMGSPKRLHYRRTDVIPTAEGMAK